MDTMTGKMVTKTAVDLAKKGKLFDNSIEIMGMLFPYAGLQRKAVEVYVEDIEKTDLPAETKAFLILNTKKTFKKIKNQKAIAEIAMKNAKQGTDFSKNSGVNEEWLERFMESARFVSSEEVQWIWGRILANEFEKPGSTPPTMIRVLSEITADLAKAFRILCGMAIDIFPLDEVGNIESGFQQLIVPYENNDETFWNIGVDFNTLNELDTLGVLKFETVTGYVKKGFSNKKILLRIDNELEVAEKYNANGFPIGNVILTSVGESLKSITETIKIDGYNSMIKNYMEKENVVFADEHDFILRRNGDMLEIVRK